MASASTPNLPSPRPGGANLFLAALGVVLWGCTIGVVADETSAASTSSASSSAATSGAGGGGGGGTSTASGAGGSGGALDCVPGRTSDDRPDEVTGYQVHVNYVLPSDGLDEALDTNGQLATSVAAFTGWLGAQTEGRTLRLDTCGGALDVRFFRMSETEAELKSNGLYLRDAIEAAMEDAGLIHPEKLEAVYYGGDAAGTCGGGAWPPTLIGHVAAMYLKGTFPDPNVPPCASNPVGASAEVPGYIDFAMLHELLHSLGMVPSCAPHHALSGHTSDDPTDLMYAGPLPWQPSVLDFGRDDYFEAGLTGCADLSKSVFLEPLPDSPEVPLGW
jgi:hypothetical protein